MLVDLATQIEAISGASPAWNLELLTQYINTIEVFGDYSNVLGFNVGNEVVRHPDFSVANSSDKFTRN